MENITCKICGDLFEAQNLNEEKYCICSECFSTVDKCPECLNKTLFNTDDSYFCVHCGEVFNNTLFDKITMQENSTDLNNVQAVCNCGRLINLIELKYIDKSKITLVFECKKCKDNKVVTLKIEST